MLVDPKDFPILKQKINGKPLIYLDNAATTQKPRKVINAISNFYTKSNANIHRGIHSLSEKATTAFEESRAKVAAFINAASPKEIVFTKNTTESINLIAKTFGELNIKAGDEIIVSALEHHSNLLPWRMLAEKKKAVLRIIPLNSDFTLNMTEYAKLISDKTRLVAITGMSNVTGTLTPVKRITSLAHKAGAKVLIDGAQYAAHIPTDVQSIDCDFFVFSAHKMLGPTGVGVLYAKKEILETLPPFLYGGDMVKSVQQDRIILNDIPHKFEAGTPNIADVIAFGSAIDYLSEIGMDRIREHDLKLLKFAKEKFSKYKEVALLCPKDLQKSGGTLSFTVKGVHPHDIAEIFNQEGIAIRAGYHCAEPLIRGLKLNSAARMSFYIYNSLDNIKAAEKALKKVLKIFK
ncbi:SufS family cysteine desulfurase [Candidatus Peregrinibacteria bacterium]|nr:SufS family cysteine desulfurase [Candidatus Peregrinibacteria bacterium]